MSISQGTSQTVSLPAGHVLTITADAVSSGRAFPFTERVGDTAGLTTIDAGSSATLGPFATPKQYQIEALIGTLSYSSAPVDFPTAAEALAAAVAALPIVPASGTVGDVKIYILAGAPVDYTDGTPPATGEGEAGIGSLAIDTAAGKLYINGGTKAQPLWKLVTSAT